MSQHSRAALGNGRPCQSYVRITLYSHGIDLSPIALQSRAEFVGGMIESYPGDALQCLDLAGLGRFHFHFKGEVGDVVQDFRTCCGDLVFPFLLNWATELDNVITALPLRISADGQTRRDRWLFSPGRCKLGHPESDPGTMVFYRRAGLDEIRHC